MARKLGRPFGFNPFGFGAVSALPTVWSTFGTALAANWDLQTTPIHKDFVGTATTTPGDSVALVFDNASWGGQSLAAVIAAQTELRGNGATGLVGSATAASYNTSTGAGSATRVNVSNQSYVTFSGLTTGRIYAVTVTNTGASSLTVRTNGNGTVVATVAAGETATAYVVVAAGAIGIYNLSDGTTTTFTVTSLKLVPGAHFYQSSAGSQPKLASYPRCGVRNLLLATATMSTQSATVTAVAHTLSFKGTGTVTLSGASTAGPLVGTGASDRVSLTFTPTAGSLTLTVSGSVTDAQLEVGSTATAYQTVTTAYNVTQAPYAQAYALVADGVDDFMVSPALDLSAYNKIAVYTAVRKVSDAASGVLMEFGPDGTATTGTFALFSPSATGANSYRFVSYGTALAAAGTGVFAAAPNTSTLTGIADISAPSIILRRNGSQVEVSTSSQGTGNYSSKTLYLFMRTGSSLPFKGAWYGATLAAGITPSAAQTAWAEAQFSNLCRQA